jgi:uncharacterized protein involved in cysteine biosynthesis
VPVRVGTFTFVGEGEQSRRHPETGREESDSERIDRNLQEMLGELRVALPGVQVLFAFLLVVPFNQRFGQVTDFQKTLYLITLLFTTASTICLIAPTAHHRLEFRRQDKENIVQTGNRIVVVGLGLLAIAMTGAVLFVTDVVYGTTTTIAAAAGVALGFALLWYAIPLRRMAAGR